MISYLMERKCIIFIYHVYVIEKHSLIAWHIILPLHVMMQNKIYSDDTWNVACEKKMDVVLVYVWNKLKKSKWHIKI